MKVMEGHRDSRRMKILVLHVVDPSWNYNTISYYGPPAPLGHILEHKPGISSEHLPEGPKAKRKIKVRLKSLGHPQQSSRKAENGIESLRKLKHFLNFCPGSM